MSEDIKLKEPGQLDSPSNEKEAQEPSQKDDIPEDWNSLSGKAQDRFKQIMKQKNEALKERQELERRQREMQEELERIKESRQQVPNPPGGDLSPEEQAAINRLKQIGAFATKEEIEAKVNEITQQMQAERDREILDRTHGSLEDKFSGEDGLPAYDRSEIEHHMRSNGIYNPEAAYRDLYFDEILEVKSRKTTTKEPYTEKTKSRIPSSQPWTPETLQERLRQSDGRAFWKKNREKIMELQSKWGSQE